MTRTTAHAVALVLCFTLGACGERRETTRERPPQKSSAAPALQINRRARELPIPKRRVTFATSDGVEVAGWFYKPRDPSAPAVVLVHELGSSRNEWAPFVPILRGTGEVAILSIDLRGHGESTKQGTKTLAWRSFGAPEWRGTVEDVRAAVAWIQERAGLQPSKVGAVGSSIGSSAALLAAADDATLAALVLVSPGLAYRGLETREAAARFAPRPMLLFASQDDAASVQAVRELSALSRRSDQNVYPGVAHGVEMGEEHADFFPRIGAWLAAKLGIARRTP